MKKIILINFFGLILLLGILIFLLQILNFFVSGPPRYYELVFNLESGNLRNKVEKLVYYKSLTSLNENDDFLKFNTKKYKNFNYTGPIKNENCGKTESGNYELIYATDKNGFRENLDSLYEKTDFIILGDSFVMSVCQNKPYDLKSQLLKLNDDFTYLNLGLSGDNYVKQLTTLLEISKDTNFNSLIWFFYEGNDYNDSLNKLDYYKKNIYPHHIQQKKTIFLNDEKNHYSISYDYEISYLYKLKVWTAEIINGLSSLLKYFKKYQVLLNENEYNEALKIASQFLLNKNIKEKYIYYIPSWQRLTNYKSKRFGLYKNNPQIKQLDQLKLSIKNISEKHGFIFLDGEETFMELNDPLEVFYYNLNTHFNRIGYRLMAEDLYNKILNYN